jgi:PQQ-dependent catabolism-associated CXXCW motif protein
MPNPLHTALAFAVAATASLLVSAQTGAGPDPQAQAQMQQERQDFGVRPPRQLHGGAMHGPTPASIPGGQVITTPGLVALIQGRQAPYIVFDVLGQPEALPGAVPAAWLSQAGTFDDAVQQQAAVMLGQATQGRKEVALVFYCLSRECWMSYNAALRAIQAGYTNVLWYRGGIEAWKAAGLPTQPFEPRQAANTHANPQRPPRDLPSPRVANAQAKFVAVTPLAPERSTGPAPARPAAGELRIGQGRYFSFALPPGWQVGEDGQFAMTLVAPDRRAMTVLVGNAGMPLNHPAARFAHDKLSVMRPQNLQLGQARQAEPAAGFRQAVEFDVAYSAQGVAYRGVAKVSVAPAYDSATMAMTAALAPADQWPGYAPWLPQVAGQVAALNGAAFGMRGIMQQNLRNSVAYGEAARQYRDWSQKNWQGVTDHRNASIDRRNFAVRENLGGVQTFANPYGTQPVEMPMTNKYYWTDRQGNFVGTDDPSANPNDGSTGDWRRMERVTR